MYPGVCKLYEKLDKHGAENDDDCNLVHAMCAYELCIRVVEGGVVGLSNISAQNRVHLLAGAGYGLQVRRRQMRVNLVGVSKRVHGRVG